MHCTTWKQNAIPDSLVVTNMKSQSSDETGLKYEPRFWGFGKQFLLPMNFGFSNGNRQLLFGPAVFFRAVWCMCATMSHMTCIRKCLVETRQCSHEYSSLQNKNACGFQQTSPLIVFSWLSPWFFFYCLVQLLLQVLSSEISLQIICRFWRNRPFLCPHKEWRWSRPHRARIHIVS